MNLTEVLDELEIPYKTHGEHHHTTEGWVSCECPFCSPHSGRYRLGINLHWGNSNCWACGPKNTTEVISLLSNTTKERIGSLLKGLTPSGYHPTTNRGKLVVPKGVGDLKPCHREYLRNRGLDPEECVRLWGLRGIGITAKLAWRIWIPIHHHGEVVSWTTRAIGGNGLRYVTASPEEEKLSCKSLLFGSDYVRCAAIVVEGPLDTMRIGPGAVATLGTAFSKAQVAEMANIPIRYLCFDQEETAQKQADELCRVLSLLPGKTHRIELESGKDPGSASEREIKQLRRLLQ